MAAGDPFRLAFDAALDFQLLLDPSGTVVGVTDGYLHAAGLRRESVVGKPLRDFPPYAGSASATSLLDERLSRVQELKIPSSTVIPEPSPCAGGTVFARAINTALLDGEQRLAFVVHQLETALTSETHETAAERRFRKLVEYDYDAIVLSDAMGRVTFASPSIERITGYAPAEFLLRPRGADLHPDDAARSAEEIREVFAQPGAVRIIQLRRLHRNGEYRNLELTVVNYLHDPDVNSIVLTVHDVTAQSALENELRRNAEQLQVALVAADAVSWERDLTTNEVTNSRDLDGFFGVPAGTTANGMAPAVHPKDLPVVQKYLAEARQRGGDIRFDFRGPDRGKDTRWYSCRGRFVTDASGRSVRQMGITWDITDAKRLQEERLALAENLRESQKLESLGVLAGGIAHDFNNLLTTIIGNVGLMMEDAEGDRERIGQLGQVETAARRAADLCKQMLAYAGKATIVLSPMDLNRIIGETAHLLRVSISKKVELRLALRPDLPNILADGTQMQQVLMNLIINASDAVDNQTGTISVRTDVVHADHAYIEQSRLAPELTEGTYVLLEVTDTGRGMPEEVQQRIFEPFFSTKGLGRGLGLAAVLGIVRSHNGALRLYSEQGRGTTFKLLFPAANRAAAAAAVDDRDEKPITTDRAILLVEDEAALRGVAKRMLAKLGLRVIDAADGREAVAIFEKRHADIAGVLMDLTMPHMSGEEALRELVRIEPNVRVLLMSGYSKRDEPGPLEAPGLVGFIQKPFTLRELRPQLRRLLA